MNAATPRKDELGSIADYVDALMDRPAADTDAAAAQRRLLAAIEDRRRKRAPSVATGPRRWAAAAAVLGVLALSAVPFLPGGGGGVAFADVQRYFEQFETMQATMTVEAAGREVMTMNILADGQGRTRLDAGELFTFVIDPVEGRMLQLLHDPRTALQVPLGPGSEVPDGARLEWLEDIRAFQGEARRLETVRRIDGREVRGFELRTGGQAMVLWATRDGEPVRLTIRQGDREEPMGVTRLNFRFDEPLASNAFSLDPPPGYQRVEGRPDAG